MATFKQELKEWMAKGHIYKTLFHFTEERNLPTIRERGLLSKAELTRLGIQPAAPGGNKWSVDADAFKGLSNYVNLCLTNKHPMEWHCRQDGRIINCVYLKIDPSILDQEGVVVSLDVANKAGTPLNPVTTEGLDWDHEVLYSETPWGNAEVQQRLKRVRRYEILVPTCVPPGKIVGGL